jgi:hypothetical protein
MHNRHLSSRTILPFVKVEVIASGAFGKVSRVFLKGSHQDIEDAGPNEVFHHILPSPNNDSFRQKASFTNPHSSLIIFRSRQFLRNLKRL